MDVKTVCLGLLTFGEASGYDLKKHFEASFDHFFATGYGSIYPALASLAEEGLVTCTEVAQEGKPDRKVYRITEAGRRRLGEALETGEPAHKLRSEFLATIYFAHLVSPERLEWLLNRRLAESDRLLCYCDACPEPEHSPAGVRFVKGFASAVILAAKKYIEEHRHLLTEPTGVRTSERRSDAVRTDREWTPL